jgi:hypothetical protein
VRVVLFDEEIDCKTEALRYVLFVDHMTSRGNTQYHLPFEQ